MQRVEWKRETSCVGVVLEFSSESYKQNKTMDMEQLRLTGWHRRTKNFKKPYGGFDPNKIFESTLYLLYLKITSQWYSNTFWRIFVGYFSSTYYTKNVAGLWYSDF